jgi:hypothetical protein
MNPLIAKQTFAEAGSVTLTPACGEIAGDFIAIQILADDTAFTTLADGIEVTAEALGGDASAPAVDQTYGVGTILYGRFSAIELSAGSCRVALASRNSL